MPAPPVSEPSPFHVHPVPELTLAGETAGEGEPLVLLHGLTATRRYVVHGSRHLLSRGRRLISYDARGHGESSPAPDRDGYGYAELEADLLAVLDELGLPRVALVGSSMGAATALRFALARPERVAALVQITPANTGPADRDELELARWDTMSRALAAEDIDAFVDIAVDHHVSPRWRGAARLATRQRVERHLHLSAVADAVRLIPRSEAFHDMDLLAGLEMPVLVVGSRDQSDPGHRLAIAEEYAARLPNARLLVEDEGSSPLAWHGARLSRAIGDFLEQAQL